MWQKRPISVNERAAQVAARLGELREKRDAEEKVRLDAEAAADAERRRREERERLKEEEERARAKSEILRYRRAKEREEDMRRLLRVLLHWKLARAIRETASKNSERTRFRIEEYQRKLQDQRQRREEEEAALADKEERLQRLGPCMCARQRWRSCVSAGWRCTVACFLACCFAWGE